MNRPRLLKLNCPVQSYAWGKVGVASVVAQLKASCDEGYVIDNAQPYAEVGGCGQWVWSLLSCIAMDGCAS